MEVETSFLICQYLLLLMRSKTFLHKKGGPKINISIPETGRYLQFYTHVGKVCSLFISLEGENEMTFNIKEISCKPLAKHSDVWKNHRSY